MSEIPKKNFVAESALWNETLIMQIRLQRSLTQTSPAVISANKPGTRTQFTQLLSQTWPLTMIVKKTMPIYKSSVSNNPFLFYQNFVSIVPGLLVTLWLPAAFEGSGCQSVLIFFTVNYYFVHKRVLIITNV